MPFDITSNLWPKNERRAFFRDKKIVPIKQVGPHCVSTVLAMLTGQTPEYFQGRINTQDPISWSDALKEFGMKLAYCPCDIRKLKFYMKELVELDDLFLLSYYTPKDPTVLLRDPDSRGWLAGSHVVILHRDKIINPQTGRITNALSHRCNKRHTKRIFRVVPKDYHRGL